MWICCHVAQGEAVKNSAGGCVVSCHGARARATGQVGGVGQLSCRRAGDPAAVRALAAGPAPAAVYERGDQLCKSVGPTQVVGIGFAMPCAGVADAGLVTA